MSQQIAFIHGLEGSSRGFKAKLLRKEMAAILIPDFRGSLLQRMSQLSAILHPYPGWILIGSSFGGLMAALYARQNPQRVQRLILLAPALVWPEFWWEATLPITVPTVIYHGIQDHIIPIDTVQKLAENFFHELEFRRVSDDHGLHKTASNLDWQELVAAH